LAVELRRRVAAAAVADGEGFQLLDAEANLVARVVEPPEGLSVIQVPLTKDNEPTEADPTKGERHIDLGSLRAGASPLGHLADPTIPGEEPK
jgi:hypothetical protein